MKFELHAKDAQSKARAGKITTDHGVIETPIFMPVGTVGTVKGVLASANPYYRKSGRPS